MLRRNRFWLCWRGFSVIVIVLKSVLSGKGGLRWCLESEFFIPVLLEKFIKKSLSLSNGGNWVRANFTSVSDSVSTSLVDSFSVVVEELSEPSSSSNNLDWVFSFLSKVCLARSILGEMKIDRDSDFLIVFFFVSVDSARFQKRKEQVERRLKFDKKTQRKIPFIPGSSSSSSNKKSSSQA